MDNKFNLPAPQLILTVNLRLAKTICKNYDLQQQNQGRQVWDPLKAIPLRQWLRTIACSGSFSSERLLTATQEQQIWSDIIQKTRRSLYPLLDVDNTAQLVQQAWQLLNDWQISQDEMIQQNASAEVSLFIDWVEQFREYCQQHGWISEALLPQRLQEVFTHRRLPLPEQIMLAGFDEMPPACARLLDIIGQFTLVTEMKNPHAAGEYHAPELPVKENFPYAMGDRKGERAAASPPSFRAIGFADAQDINRKSLPLYSAGMTDLEAEITQMAQWAKIQVTNHSMQSVGCVIPQLTQHRSLVARIFKRVFAGNNQFNISAGQNLDEFEMVSVGLQALALNIAKLPVESLGQILQSPYLCQNQTDINLGAQLDAECRQSKCYELPLTAVFTAITHQQNDYPGHTWLTRWRAFAAVSSAAASRQLPSAWATHFAQQLNALGWPGGRSLNSLEYQVAERWRELLAELTELDVITGEVTHHTALHCLRRLTLQTVFQPRSESQAPAIQILGVLESSGLYFDALWIAGLDDRHWPPPAQPNPFLPHGLQVRKQMPHASPQRELTYARQIIQRLLCSAPVVRLSCSAPEPDQQGRFSRLLGMPEETLPLPPLCDPPSGKESSLQRERVGANPFSSVTGLPEPALAEIIFAAARQEIITDHGPAILATEKVRGGSGILTQQAACPFRAFATFRLNAVALDEPELGVSALEHGILAHQVLEQLWKILKNQQNLLSINADELQKLIEKTVEQAIHEKLRQPESPFALIEKNRLVSIIGEWLALEKQRPPFQVLAQEAERSIEIAGLRLHLKIDRIDQLGDGSQFLIDYKTGPTQIQSWFNERLQQPQLPLYTLDSHFSGIGFAQLQIGRLCFKGLHAEHIDTESSVVPAGIISVDSYKDLTVPKTWQDLLTYWRTALQKLSADFQSGVATVDPAEQDATCQTCQLQALCRINSCATPEES